MCVPAAAAPVLGWPMVHSVLSTLGPQWLLKSDTNLAAEHHCLKLLIKRQYFACVNKADLFSHLQPISWCKFWCSRTPRMYSTSCIYLSFDKVKQPRGWARARECDKCACPILSSHSRVESADPIHLSVNQPAVHPIDQSVKKQRGQSSRSGNSWSPLLVSRSTSIKTIINQWAAIIAQLLVKSSLFLTIESFLRGGNTEGCDSCVWRDLNVHCSRVKGSLALHLNYSEIYWYRVQRSLM